MRKLMHSKKGFTLVELMIVVVIMAILVAVAVPIYGAVTKNAEKRSCQSNMRIITENMNQYQMSGGKGGDQISFDVLSKTFTGNLTKDTDASFTKLFNEKGIPTCPSDNTSPYSVIVTAASDTVDAGVKVRCTSADKADHNPAEA